MSKFIFLLIFISLFTIILFSCNKSSQEPLSDWNNGLSNSPFFSVESIFNKMIYDKSTRPIDAYQICAKSFGVYNIEDSSFYIDIADDFAYSIYKFGEIADFIDYSKCLNYDLIPQVGQLPHRYILDWSNTPLIGGQNIIWKFKYPNLSEVQTSVPMPQEFGNLRVNTSYLDPAQGCILSWDNTGPEDIILFATLVYINNENDISGGARIKFIDFIPNSGNFEVTPQLLNDLGADSLCIKIAFYFGKANIKIDKFDNGTKQVATIGYIEKTIAIPTIFAL